MSDPDDQSYIDAGFNDMRIFNLVDEKDRAWHSGLSAWAGHNNLKSQRYVYLDRKYEPGVG